MTDLREGNSYDYAIVGAGPSSIGLIYGLLLPYDKCNTKPDFNIAVIERGTTSNTPLSPEVRDPKNWYRAAHSTTANINNTLLASMKTNSVSAEYETTPQKMLGNRRLTVPTGKGLGGGSNINACLVVRPTEDDFINWPKQWTEEVISKKGVAEDHEKMSLIMSSVLHIENEMRNNGALQQETYPGTTTGGEEYQWQENISKFCHCDEFGKNIDPRLSTVTNALMKDEKYTSRRANYYDAILEPLLDRNPQLRKHITFYTGVQAERLLFDCQGKKTSDELEVIGVECSQVIQIGLKSFFSIKAKNVILCSGAILSPALLLASGIGKEEDLKAEKIRQTRINSDKSTHKEWDFVGKRLKDHVVTARVFFTLKPLPNRHGLNSVRGWLPLNIDLDPKSNSMSASKAHNCSRVLFKIIDGSSSSMIVPGVVRSVFYREYKFKSQFCSQILNLFLYGVSSFSASLLILGFKFPPINWILSTFTFQVLVCLMNPDSMGSVKIQRKCLTKGIPAESRLSDFDFSIDPSYLHDEKDIERLESSWNLLARFAPKWPLLKGGIEILPGTLYRLIFRDAYLKRYFADASLPYFHYSGSCGMNCVVDENLRVKGVNNLFICDASVLIEPISVPPALTLAALGLTGSRFIRKQISGKVE